MHPVLIPLLDPPPPPPSPCPIAPDAWRTPPPARTPCPSYIRQLNDSHGIDGFVEFYMAEGGLPACYLFHPSGQTLEIILQVTNG